MLGILEKSKDRYRHLVNRRHLILPLLLTAFASVASGQEVLPTSSSPACAVGPAATYQVPPDIYPLTSNQYAVQYRLGGASGWTDAQVFISNYGETMASPYRSDSGYTVGETSMSYVSIPAGSNTSVQLRVALLSGTASPTAVPFFESDQVSVRPSAKGIQTRLMIDGTVQIFTSAGADFTGQQFILWWNRSSTQGGAIQGLAFFINPIYTEPTGSNVQVINSAVSTSDISTSSSINTLDFEGFVPIGGTGNQALVVPANIDNIYLGQSAWVQGKFFFPPNQQPRSITGPGVLDVSRFEYDLRACDDASGYGDQGDDALSVPAGDSLNKFDVEGIIISDTNHAATAPLFNSTVTNVKTISWNGVNGALKLEDNTTASNVFVRSGDDSLMMWGSDITVTDATVWQNYNGGVVNLGWSNNSTGNGSLINGLYVVKTDWTTPTAPTFTMIGPNFVLNDQNNAVIASMMAPGTNYGATQASLFENIYVEDRPQVLLSLKILPPDCNLVTFDGGCPTPVDLTQQSTLNLNIENLFTPPPIEENSIGFENLVNYPNPAGAALPSPYTLEGYMKIQLTNVFVPGQVTTNGNNVYVDYDFNPIALLESLFPGLL
jgi:hypothetical protein